jgi:alkylated DNA repair dioxygenase AlkB
VASFQASLFAGGEPVPNLSAPFQRLHLDATAWVDTAEGFLFGADSLFDHLDVNVRWRRGRRRMYDRMVDDPRLSRWYAEGEDLPHPALVSCREALSQRYGVSFATLGLNYYRDGHDSVAFHRDRELRHLDDTLVAIVSLGSARPFLLRPRGGGPSRSLRPASGDLLVMGGACQASFEHAVPKSTSGAARISATYRWSSGPADASTPTPLAGGGGRRLGSPAAPVRRML